MYMYVIMYFDCYMNTYCYQLFESVVLYRNHICLYPQNAMSAHKHMDVDDSQTMMALAMSK